MDPKLISGSEAVKWSLLGPYVARVRYVACIPSYHMAVGAVDIQQHCAGDNGRSQRGSKGPWEAEFISWSRGLFPR